MNSFHNTVQPHAFAESYMSTSEDVLFSSRSRLVSQEADSGYTFSMEHISSAEELRVMEDVMQPIPLPGISSDTSSENARKSFGRSSGANTRPIGTHNNNIQERLAFPLKSNCTLDEMKTPADDEDPLEFWTLNRDYDQGRVFSTAECTSQMKDRSFDDILTFLFDSKCSIITRTEGEDAVELDQSRFESDSNEPHLVMLPTVNDVLSGKGGKTVDHNLHYTSLCVQVADEYEATTKRGLNGKKGVALRVVEVVQRSGGRFLEPSSTGTGWIVVSEEASIKKAAHCIRDAVNRRTKRRRLGE
jgi:hypothetical protein